jgi:hypothetical protein
VVRRFDGQPETDKASPPDDAASAPDFEVVCYAEDLLVRGRVVIPTARLTDLLATSPKVTLRDARATVLRDGREVRVPEIEVLRDELIAMSMAGPRGDPNRRVSRLDLPLVAVLSGPYRIWGHQHVPRAVDPVLYARHHGSFLPLTDVVIAYELNEVTVTDVLAGLIVNLEQVDLLADADLQSVEAIFETVSPPLPDAGEDVVEPP